MTTAKSVGCRTLAAVEHRLRVLLVSQPTIGGAARCVHQLAGAAVRAGIEVTVVSPAGGDLRGWVEGEGARWVELPMTRAPGPADLLRIRPLRTLIQEHDVVHLHSSKAGALGRLTTATLGRRRPPCLFTPHGWSWQSGGRLVPVYKLFERLAAPFADAIVAVSDAERTVGQSALGRWVDRVVVIENGVDLSLFTPDGPVAPRREEPLLVCVGRLAYPKAQDVAIRALARLDDTTARLRLVGDGPDLPELEQLAADLGVARRVELIGAVPDPAPHVRAADVVLLPSLSEALSLAMLEAMACGAAVVSSRVQGSEALDGVGVVVTPGSDTELADAVNGLLADPAERERLGRLARLRVEKQFPVEASTSRTLALWRSLADHSVGARGAA